jgi:hypothetical protein
MQTEQTLETVNLQLFDPFGENNLVTPQHIIEENTVISSKPTKSTRVPRVPKVVKPKFIISGDLKKRLIKLTKESTNENAINIANCLLNLKHDNTGYNYLGLSNSDYSKISYLDSTRIEKFKDDSSTELALDSKSKIYQTYTDWRGDLKVKEINIYAKNIKKPFSLATLKDVLKEDCINEAMRTNLEIRQEDFRNGRNKGFIEVDGENVYAIGAYVAKFDPEFFQSMLAEENNTGGFSRYLYEGRNINISLGNIYASNQKYAELASYGYYNYYIKPSVVQKSKLWDSKVRYHTKVGKIVRKIFQNQFNDVEITDFSEEYQRLIVINKVGTSYVEASGEEIKNYYLGDNARNSGPLGNSCMRHSRCQGYFDLYTNNDFCKLAVLKSRNLVAARTLLWKINDKIYYDRIYHADNESSFILENILKDKGYTKVYGSSLRLSIPLNEQEYLDYGLYPYMDTFCYYSSEDQCLTNYEPEFNYHTMRNTDGSINNHDSSLNCCYVCDETMNEDDTITISYGNSHGQQVCTDCGIWTNDDEAVLYEDTTRTYDDEIYHTNNVVELHNGNYAYVHDRKLKVYENDYGYFIESAHDYEEIDGCYYHLSDPELLELLKLKENQNN